MMTTVLSKTPKSRYLLLVLILLTSFNSFAEITCGNIEGFQFSNGHESVNLIDGRSYITKDLPDNFYVNLQVNGYSQSVRYEVENLETGDVFKITENSKPYTFPAGNGKWNLGSGTFRLKANLYKFDLGIYKCDTKTIVFTISDSCLANAGTLTATSETVTLSNGEAMISATPNGDINIPSGYSKIYVLTSGSGLVIEQVSTESPEFTVTSSGLYTIHTLVYDANADSANFLDLGVVVPGTTTGVDVLNIVGAAGICASLDAAGAPVMVEDCSANAGTLTATSETVTLSNGEAMISATPNGDINIPSGYSKIYVLTSGSGLVIEQVSTESPEFTVMSSGLYTIHTLVYDGNTDSANYLNLGIVEVGVTTGFDVLNVVGAAGICASLDAAGAPVMVEDCSANAGTLTATSETVTLSNGEAMISATPNGDINIPSGYSKIYVLTSGSGLVIEQVSTESPEFTVMSSGLYTIHTLVYDGNTDSANYLNLGIVEVGVTTGVDVLNIVGAAGICASLDAAGAPVMVEDCSANAGTLTATSETVTLSNGEAMISATPNGDINIPSGYSKIYVLTSGSGLVIEQVSTESPEFTVTSSGLYTIHTLVYDGNTDSANYLNLGIVEVGVTTGVDVLNIVGAAGICASLDAAGAPIMVEDCSANAGTLTATSESVVLTNGEAMLSATPNGDINIPSGYSKIYVLTSGSGLVIEQVSTESPEFTVTSSGLYTIHTLVYDANADSANFLDLGVVVPGTTTGVDVLNIVGAAGICASLDAAGAPIMVEDCSANAGTLTATSESVVLTNGEAMLSATPNGDINIPSGYSKIYVLTSGSGLVIEQVSTESPEFTVTSSGLYTIHTLVYDANADSANFLDLGVVVPGTTTGVDVLNIVGAAGICASLDAAGAPVMVEDCSANAGTLTATSESVVLTNGEAMLSATPNGDINIPSGYSKIYVLTSGSGLVIEQVSTESPEFTVMSSGLYTIHTLVYDANADSANFLDLGVVVPGTTTGVDVLNIVGAAGICASLDAAGAPIMVEDCSANAGTLTATSETVTLSNGEAMISATPNGDINIPSGYSKIYVLTSGSGLVIEQVSTESPEFTVTSSGLYTIHTLVYDANADSANFLDLGVVVPGTTTGVDVLNIVGAAGICASLDAAGAPVMVEDCSANAGTLTATSETVTLSNGEAMISATPNGDINIPSGYSKIYVLTSGSGLVIEQVSTESPEFTVMSSGLYTIHTLVYDGNTDSANYLNLGIVEVGVTTGVDVLNIVGAAGICASLDAAGAPVMVEDCSANAGTLTATSETVTLSNGEAMISATPNGDINIPSGYSKIYVLTSGSGLVIEQVSTESPEFTVMSSGLYTIHTLVYDGNTDSANYLNLGIVEVGVTTGFDVLNVVGAAGICASLDAAGAPVMVEQEEGCVAYSGTLYSPQAINCLDNGSTVITAQENEAAVLPKGYQQLFVLTNAFTLTILDVSNTPTFEINKRGFYRIHSLVYNPETLDLSIVEPGKTTGFDVANLISNNSICASLDVQGALNLVIGSRWFCYFFNKYFSKGSSSKSIAGKGSVYSSGLNDLVNKYSDYETFKNDFIRSNGDSKFFPNPVINTLSVEIQLLDDETMNYRVIDIRGRQIMSGEANNLKYGTEVIDTSKLNLGMYVVQFVSEYRTITKKIIVKK